MVSRALPLLLKNQQVSADSSLGCLSQLSLGHLCIISQLSLDNLWVVSESSLIVSRLSWAIFVLSLGCLGASLGRLWIVSESSLGCLWIVSGSSQLFLNRFCHL